MSKTNLFDYDADPTYEVVSRCECNCPYCDGNEEVEEFGIATEEAAVKKAVALSKAEDPDRSYHVRAVYPFAPWAQEAMEPWRKETVKRLANPESDGNGGLVWTLPTFEDLGGDD